MGRRRRISIAVAFALCAAILIPVVHHYQLRIALARHIAGLKAKGEPMDLAQLIPSPVPPEQNGAESIINSITNLEPRNVLTTNAPMAMCIVAPGRAIVGWQQPDIRSSDGTNTWEEVTGELAAAKSALDDLRSISNHPFLDFHLNYQQGPDMLLPHLTTLRRAGNLLNASALLNLHDGRMKEACANIRTILALVNGQSQEPIQISQKVRMANAFVAITATWEVLQDPLVSEDDLRLLQQDWQSLSFLKEVEQAYLNPSKLSNLGNRRLRGVCTIRDLRRIKNLDTMPCRIIENIEFSNVSASLAQW
jgi:hypothetical protein